MTFKDGKTAAAAAPWRFLCENYALTGHADIQVARADKGGWLKIEVDTTDPSFYIGGVTYVYLEDQTVLVCTDKGMRENINGKAAAWYVFTAAEMERLKKTDIQSIRFNIRGTASKFSSQTGNFTAVNKKRYFNLRGVGPSTYDTAKAITQMYPST